MYIPTALLYTASLSNTVDMYAEVTMHKIPDIAVATTSRYLLDDDMLGAYNSQEIVASFIELPHIPLAHKLSVIFSPDFLSYAITDGRKSGDNLIKSFKLFGTYSRYSKQPDPPVTYTATKDAIFKYKVQADSFSGRIDDGSVD